MYHSPLMALLFLALLLNSGYIWAFAAPTLFYVGNLVAHLVLGIGLAAVFGWQWFRRLKARRGTAVAGLLFAVALGCGLYLVGVGNLSGQRRVLVAHIAAALLGTVALAPFVWRAAGPGYRQAFAACLAFTVIFPACVTLYNRRFPDPRSRIRNPQVAPLSMNEEGGGPKSPFFPSSAQTNVGGIIPSNFFMDSERCGGCHKDIYEQWKSSMHHFASFNNQFYRKSIEYMQSVVGTQPSKWCAGCHDHAVFFNGRFEKPIKDQIDTPEAHAGLACTSCHSIVARGQHAWATAGFTIEYPPLHDLASSQEQVHPRARRLSYLSRSGAAPADFHEAVHAPGFGGVLLHLPQGPSGRAGQQLPLDPRLQRLRQLAGQRRFRAGRAVVLLSAEDVRPASTATCRWSLRRIRATTTARSTRTAFRGATRRCRS